ncbi:MAG: hypothetical protein HZC47_03625 [Methanobacterium sp.]|uniref:DUF4405 domain-containing protein n=1 Tax=Methanobacterium sp. TaxID=2164 RepID=UPI003D64E99E|nr:hypothetical protein [Methanobacterium sp.]
MILMRKVGLLVIAAIILLPIAVYAVTGWNDCPYELTDDSFPGQCFRYIDTNHDSICDHSQSPPQNISNVSGNFEETSGKNTVSGFSILGISFKSGLVEGYYLIPLTIVLIVFYALSYRLYKNNKIRAHTYKKIWNVVLTGSFIAVIITGLILIYSMEYAIRTPYELSADFWHAEAGIIMGVTFLFHIHIYWKSVKKMFNGKF